jgi:hypothetical protein
MKSFTKKPCSKLPVQRTYRRIIFQSWSAGLNDYDPLREYLSQQTAIELVLAFDQIEEILGFALPRASQRASWWAKERNPENARPQRDAIRDGGYEATRLGDSKGVRFRRLSAGRFKPKH